MEKILKSKHRSLIFFLITCILTFFGYFFFVFILSQIGDLPKKEGLLFSDFTKLVPLLISLYIWISVTVCSVISIREDLKPYNEKGLIYWLIYGLIYGLILGLILGLIAGLILGLIAGLIFAGLIAGLIDGLIAGLIAGLISGLIAEFK